MIHRNLSLLKIYLSKVVKSLFTMVKNVICHAEDIHTQFVILVMEDLLKKIVVKMIR